MKLSSTALLLALLPSTPVAEVTIYTDAFALSAEYDSRGLPSSVDCDDYLASGFIRNDFLFVLQGADLSDSQLIRVPLIRDTMSGRITDIDFSNAVVVLDQMDIDNGFHGFNDGPGGQVFYTVKPSHNVYEIHHGSFDLTTDAFSFTHKMTSSMFQALNAFDPDGEPFVGLEGLAFSPASENIDPGTGVGFMQGVDGKGYWQVGLTGDASAYNPASAEFLCSLPQNGGTLAYAPSGSLAGNAIIGGFREIWALELDNVSGLCIDNSTGTATLGTDNPKVTMVVDGISSNYGIIFDPVTNDMFSTREGFGEIYQYSGFPPGIDVELVLANIEAILIAIGNIILNGGIRRRLDLEKQGVNVEEVYTAKKYRSNDHGSSNGVARKLSKSAKSSNCEARKRKRHLHTKSSKAEATECEGETLVVDQAAIEQAITGSLADLSAGSGSAEALAQEISDPLDAVFADESFTTDVMAGGEATQFVDNVSAVRDGLDTALAGVDNLSADAQASLATQQALLDDLFELLLSVVEGN